MADLTLAAALVILAFIATAQCAPTTKGSRTLNLVTFDEAKGTTFKWSTMNDPVMGGASTSTFSVSDSTGKFSGTCRVVKFLHAPGFAKASTSSGWFSKNTFKDASAFVHGSLLLHVRSSTPDYLGFMVDFQANGIPKHGAHGTGSFKAPFKVKGTDWQTVKVPFNSFSDDWSEFTGRCDTKDPTWNVYGGKQHVCCSAEHPEVCPTAAFLGKITNMAVWAEGVAGDFQLEIKSIGVTTGSMDASSNTRSSNDDGSPLFVGMAIAVVALVFVAGGVLLWWWCSTPKSSSMASHMAIDSGKTGQVLDDL